MEPAGLPEELIEDIFTRVPMKSLLRFKSASKNWYSLISKNHEFDSLISKNHEFAKLQSQQSRSKNVIIWDSSDHSRRIKNVYSYFDVDSNESYKINFTGEQIYCRLVGSAPNGLICLVPNSYKTGYFYIWNPCTGEHKRIFLPEKINVINCSIFGFGYDSISDDYKLVASLDASHIHIFSLKTNSWRKIDYEFKYRIEYVTVLHSNGSLHWCVDARQITIFDLATEKISSLDLPQQLVSQDCRPCDVFLFTNYHGSLIVSGCKSVWMFTENPKTKFWAKLIHSSVLKGCPQPVGISKRGELVYGIWNDELGIVKSDIYGRVSDGAKSRIKKFAQAFVYKQSLISPRYIFRSI